MSRIPSRDRRLCVQLGLQLLALLLLGRERLLGAERGGLLALQACAKVGNLLRGELVGRVFRGGLGAGYIVTIILGVIAALALLVGLLVLWYRRRKQAARATDP